MLFISTRYTFHLMVVHKNYKVSVLALDQFQGKCPTRKSSGARTSEIECVGNNLCCYIGVSISQLMGNRTSLRSRDSMAYWVCDVTKGVPIRY